jgi:hypothetical protein
MRDLGTRLLADNLFGVAQTITVPKGKVEALAAVNRFIDDVWASGFLRGAIGTSGVVGIEPTPAGLLMNLRILQVLQAPAGKTAPTLVLGGAPGLTPVSGGSSDAPPPAHDEADA